MFEKGKLETNPEARKDIYCEMIAYFVDACPSIPLIHRETLHMWDKNLNATVYDGSSQCYCIYEWSRN